MYQGGVLFSGFGDQENRQFTALLRDSYTTHTHAQSE